MLRKELRYFKIFKLLTYIYVHTFILLKETEFTTIEKAIEMADNIFIDPDEPQPLNYINYKEEADVNCKFIDYSDSFERHLALNSPLTYNELLLLNVIFTKVHAHPNGYFAQKIPKWYEMTFDKSLPQNWLDVIKKSRRFFLDKIQNEVILYAIEEEVTTKDVQSKFNID